VATIEEAWDEVLDAIECDTEGEERCLLLTDTVRAAMMAVHDDACWACSRGLKECPKRRQIAALGVEDGR